MSAPMTCCEAFAASLESGTDAEGYSSLIRVSPGGESFDFVGSNNPTIQFCPWCGTDKRMAHPIVVAARRVVACVYGPDRGDFEDFQAAVSELSSELDIQKGMR